MGGLAPPACKTRVATPAPAANQNGKCCLGPPGFDARRGVSVASRPNRWSRGGVEPPRQSNWGRVYAVSDSGGIIGQAYGRKIHAREVLAIDEAGDGLCWVRLTRFGDDWLLIRSDARDVSRAVRRLRQIPAGQQSDRFPEVGP